MPEERIVHRNALAVATCDGFPVSRGHTLVMPRRHVASWFDVTPDGYNIGINDGPAAGQTIRHLHVHLIPRYAGDAEDPRGGVRWVFPHEAAYWKE